MMSYWGALLRGCGICGCARADGRAGYKFEALSLIPDTLDATPREYIEGREDMVVNNHAQYCSIVQTGIGNTGLIIGGEVDGGTYPSFPPISLYAAY